MKRLKRMRERQNKPVSKLMRQIAAVAKRRKLPCVITPEDVRREP